MVLSTAVLFIRVRSGQFLFHMFQKLVTAPKEREYNFCMSRDFTVLFSYVFQKTGLKDYY